MCLQISQYKQIVFKNLQSYLFLIWLHCQESIDESASLIKPQSWHCSLGMAFFFCQSDSRNCRDIVTRRQWNCSESRHILLHFILKASEAIQYSDKDLCCFGLESHTTMCSIRTLWFHFDHRQVNMALGSESRMDPCCIFHSCWEDTIYIWVIFIIIEITQKNVVSSYLWNPLSCILNVGVGHRWSFTDAFIR